MKFKPIPHDVEKDKSYFWCSCGKVKTSLFVMAVMRVVNSHP